jgi:hypothetical protein
MELLQQFDWNWELVADHLDGDANELNEQFGADVDVHRNRDRPTPSAPLYPRLDCCHLENWEAEKMSMHSPVPIPRH